ncbi:Pycsar system effector family protein [Streptosporangium sp. CA-135522]|uniref:Pycsar system effector family protein n=1 Tax=Streptosporangium sp. CA-135522 TaxID=3240072 RepID=UPI003D89B586
MLRIVRDTLAGRLSEEFKKSEEETVPVSGEGTVSRGRDEALSYIVAVLADVRDDIGRVNRKAAVLLAAAVLGVVLGNRWRPGDLPSQVEWLWWAGVFFCVMGILMLVGTLYPRSARLAGQTVERRRSYAGRVHADGPPPADSPVDDSRAGAFARSALAELRQRLAGQDTRLRADRLVLRIRRLSAVADAKRRYVRRAVILLVVSVACCLVSVVIGQAMTSWDFFGRPMAPAILPTPAAGPCVPPGVCGGSA